jgi:MoaA/NifB/PqqE/SkfB family radical SAM enzyme
MKLDTLIFFVTSRCNSKCRTCFYWEELNQPGDLSLGEIAHLSSTMPALGEIWFSGGEPTLREELPEIVALFYENTRIRSINFPTNGLLPERLIAQLEAIHDGCPTLRVNLNLALDGLGATHDRLRGVPGNFERALHCLGELERLRRRRSELRIHVNSVICRENLGEMLPLAELIRDRFDLDGHYFQVIRGEPMDPTLLKVHRETVSQLYRSLRPIYRHYAAKIHHGDGGFGAYLKRAAYLGALTLYHHVQEANLDSPARWPMPCTAGETIAVLDANGDVRACELRQKIGNLRQVGGDWRRLWESAELRREREAIRREGCWCTHVCFIHASLKASPKALAYDLPRAYLAQRNPGGIL